MVRINLLNGEIEITSDAKVNNEDDLLKELNRVLCFTITIYKKRLEKIQQRKISESEEVVLNGKIKDSIVMIPLDDIRYLIKESDL